ncbi:MAG: response regulator [Lachnospiraceae bacterium]|nr:response regulator [Lachnospiraceae bacterium]
MKNTKVKRDDISDYFEEQEFIANTYVMRCYFVTVVVLTITFILNQLRIFVIEQGLMLRGFVSTIIIYFLTVLVYKYVLPRSRMLKYFILFSFMVLLTINGVLITYHVVLVSLFPFLFATLYASKRVMRYIYVLMVISTVIVVYGGYYFGLCDANMTLLTSGSLQQYVKDGEFTLTQVNPNPEISLMLFFVIPRCLIYFAFVFVCNSIYSIVSGSIEKARLSKELEKAKIEAENANLAKTQFLARVSHEIRTPINAIIGMNEMILRESTQDEVLKYAGDVENSSVLLLNLINELLDSTKIESGKMELVPVRYEMGSLLNDIYNMTEVKAREKKLELIFDVAPDIPNECIGDDKRIRQVLLNLLSNAVKYTRQGTVTLEVACRTIGEETTLHFAVKDTGIGIRKEDIDRIYDEFKRFDVHKNRNVEGTGLGMNIARQFLQLMGSDLQIESEYEKGSVFSFDLVQKVANQEPIGDFRERIHLASGKNKYKTAFTAPDAKVLVVDDYEMNLKVFKGLLKPSQIQVHEATGGKECLSMLKKERYDIVFLDHMMPEMDGIDTLKAIRDEKLCEGVPIIMLTANAILGDKEKYLSLGFDDFLSKPLIPEKLDKMIIKHLPEGLVRMRTLSEAPSADNMMPEVETPSTDDMVLTVEASPDLDIERGLATCSGDEEFYMEILGDFSRLKIKEELEAYRKENDFTNYCIRVHGFKNSAYSVGATKLGDLAYEMEKMTKENLSEEIEVMQTRLFAQYDSICAKYNEMVLLRKGENNL